MKKVWILSTLIGIVLGVVGYVTSQVVIMQRPLSSQGLSAGVGYGTRVPVVADDGRPPTDGELFVVRQSGTLEPALMMYSALAGTWLEVITGERTTAQTIDGDINFGSNDVDDFVFNGPVTYNVLREDFTFGRVAYHVEEDFTAAVVTDVSENMFFLNGSQLPLFHYRFEAPGGPGYAGTADPIQDGTLVVTNLVDEADNEGVDIRFGGDPAGLGYQFNEDTGNSVYCEIEMTIADISETDSVYFGWHLVEAYQDAGAYASHNTSAFVVVQDNAGDIDIETELNAGGTLNDDSGITWADGASHVLRVTMSADSVAFVIDGTAVTQTNAVLNADNGDEFVCGLGMLNATGDATPAPGITVSYVEIGVSQ